MHHDLCCDHIALNRSSQLDVNFRCVYGMDGSVVAIDIMLCTINVIKWLHQAGPHTVENDNTSGFNGRVLCQDIIPTAVLTNYRL